MYQKLVKNIVFRINIFNDFSEFADDHKEFLLKTLRNTYEGRCYDKCYIESIMSIVSHSEFEFIYPSIVPTLYIEVITKCRVVYVNFCSVIWGTKKINIKPSENLIILESDMFSCRVSQEMKNSSLFSDISIPVRVLRASYAIGDKKITTTVIPFCPLRDLVYTFSFSDISKEREYTSGLLFNKEEIEATNVEKNAKDILTIEYKISADKLTLNNIDDLAGLDKVYIRRDAAKLSELSIYYSKNAEDLLEKGEKKENLVALNIGSLNGLKSLISSQKELIEAANNLKSSGILDFKTYATYLENYRFTNSALDLISK